MIIRPAGMDDVPFLFTIAKDNLGEGYSKEGFVSSLKNEHTLVLILEKDSEPFGYCVFAFAADEAELTQIAVKHELRGHGAGRKLLNHGILALREKGVNTLYLEVRESNAPAIAMYDSFGMVNVGKRPRFYNNPVEDALILRLDIDNA